MPCRCSAISVPYDKCKSFVLSPEEFEFSFLTLFEFVDSFALSTCIDEIDFWRKNDYDKVRGLDSIHLCVWLYRGMIVFST